MNSKQASLQHSPRRRGGPYRGCDDHENSLPVYSDWLGEGHVQSEHREVVAWLYKLLHWRRAGETGNGNI